MLLSNCYLLCFCKIKKNQEVGKEIMEEGKKRRKNCAEVKKVIMVNNIIAFLPVFLSLIPPFLSFELQIIEACIVSILTSAISFGLPLLRKCSPCPDSDPTSGIECPRPPGMYGNYVNVRGSVLRCFFDVLYLHSYFLFEFNYFLMFFEVAILVLLMEIQ